MPGVPAGHGCLLEMFQFQPLGGWGLHCLPPVVLWLNALGILPRAFHLKASPLQGCERSHVSPVYAGSGTSHISPETYPDGSCGCRGINTGCHLLPCSVCQYLTPACGWPPIPAGEPSWPPRGLHYVGSLSLRTGSGIPFGSWAVERPQQPPLWPSSNMVVSPHLLRWLLREDRMSLMAPSICSGLQGGRLGSLLSKYTLW